MSLLFIVVFPHPLFPVLSFFCFHVNKPLSLSFILNLLSGKVMGSLPALLLRALWPALGYKVNLLLP
jgi:hypothetical protein